MTGIFSSDTHVENQYEIDLTFKDGIITNITHTG